MTTKKRIFWMGMHKVLMQTELPRLRELGFEVFNPPYLSEVVDQSATLDWDSNQESTLPKDVFDKLSKTRFFYNSHSEETAEILNEYFDAVVVTINPDWLKEMLAVYEGPLIFRTFGQPYSLSDSLIQNRVFETLSERDNFWFIPNTELGFINEDQWLVDKSIVVPYCLTPDITSLANTWDDGNGDIGFLCPRALDIEYYRNNYTHLKHYFGAPQFKIFGAQVVPVHGDQQVIGTIPREELIQKFLNLSGFGYHYTEPTVCYLPPLELMTLGGPVFCQEGSLLARYFNDAIAPNIAKDVFGLQDIANRLSKGDSIFTDELIDAQQGVRQLYQPEYVWPIFDKVFLDILNGKESKPAQKQFTRKIEPSTSDKERIFVPFHEFGPLIQRVDGNYHCSEGIARVARQGTQVLFENGHELLISSYAEHSGKVHGYFSAVAENPDQFKILLLDDVSSPDMNTKALQSAKNLVKRIPVIRDLARNAIRQVGRVRRGLKYLVQKLIPLSGSVGQNIRSNMQAGRLRSYVKQLQKSDVGTIFIPHYHLFPEIGDVKDKKVVLYLPDYFPHLYPGEVTMGSTPEIARIAESITKISTYVFTNSRFTQRYLPETHLKINPNKIVYAPLPNLNKNAVIEPDVMTKMSDVLPELFVFYPTRERPSKRLWDFLATLIEVNKRRLAEDPDAEKVYGVLTNKLSEKLEKKYPEAMEYVVVLSELSDIELAAVYTKSTALLFTSENEGNFPTQINEALNYDIPVIATNIPLISEELADLEKMFPLVDVGDIDGFASAVENIIEDREDWIKMQQPARKHIREYSNYDNFSRGFMSMIENSAQ